MPKDLLGAMQSATKTAGVKPAKPAKKKPAPPTVVVEAFGTAKRCTSAPIGVHKMQSDSDASKVYIVDIGPPTPSFPSGQSVCSCIAYAIDRNRKGGKNHGAWGDCKHIRRRIAEGGCGWSSIDGVAQTFPNICPLCQDATVEYTPITGTEDVDEIITRLKALRDRVAAS